MRFDLFFLTSSAQSKFSINDYSRILLELLCTLAWANKKLFIWNGYLYLCVCLHRVWICKHCGAGKYMFNVCAWNLGAQFCEFDLTDQVILLSSWILCSNNSCPNLKLMQNSTNKLLVVPEIFSSFKSVYSEIESSKISLRQSKTLFPLDIKLSCFLFCIRSLPASYLRSSWSRTIFCQAALYWPRRSWLYKSHQVDCHNATHWWYVKICNIENSHKVLSFDAM